MAKAKKRAKASVKTKAKASKKSNRATKAVSKKGTRKSKAGKNKAAVNTQRSLSVDMERVVEFDFMRATEAAALNAYKWLGRGNRKATHAAAVDAMCGMMDLINISATVVSGDGSKPQPDGINAGEKLGLWSKGSFEVDMALLPIDGINLVGKGLPGSISAMVAARKIDGKSALMHIPCRYALKMAYGPAVKNSLGEVHLDASVRDNLEIIAGKLGKRVCDVTVAVLERDRHKKIIRDIRKAGASARLFSDGDVAYCMAPSIPDTGIDVYMGIGGAAESVVAAAAVKCLEGDMLVRPEPQSPKEKRAVIKALGKNALETMYRCDDLAQGNHILFCATAITSSNVLRGVHVQGSKATTSSVVMRSRYYTVRRIEATHDLSKKTIRLRSSDAEARL